MEIIVLIPAYNPDNKLIDIVKELKEKTKYKILIVNDGSSIDIKNTVFNECSKYSTIINHNKNLGKGQAIKTGLKYIYDNFSKDSIILTADADGQHKVCDIIKLIKASAHTKDTLILGSRHFSDSAPLRSRFGNALTRLIFNILTHKKLKDTQTGLRCFPCEFIPDLLKIKGLRYEYEMNMLLEIIKSKRTIKEIEIETVYINDNSSSHFHVFRDSYLIYKNLIRFSRM